MSQYQHLPLYAKTYEFIKQVYRTVGQFRKEYKFSLGAELVQLIWTVLDEIIRANDLPDNQKAIAIERIGQTFEKFKIRWRLAYEIRLMTDVKFSIAQKDLEEIGKMIGGWQNWAKNKK